MRYTSMIIILCLVIQAGCDSPVNKTSSIAEITRDTAYVNSLIAAAHQRQIDDRDSALRAIESAEIVATELHYWPGLANALFMHGNLLYYSNRYNEALIKFTESLERAQKLGDTLLQAKCMVQLGSLHMATDNPYLALKLNYESLRMFEKLNDKKGIAMVYNFLGSFKTGRKEYDTAEYFFEKSLSIHLKLGDSINVLHNRGNLAFLYRQKGDYVKAEKIYHDILSALKHSGDLYTESVIYYNLADLETERGEPSRALQYLKEGIKRASISNDTVMLASMLGNAGELFIKTGKIDSASQCLQNALICAKTISDIETEWMIYRQMVFIDSIQGRYSNAMAKQKSMMILKDSIHALKLENNARTIELKYQNEKQQQQVEFQLEVIRSHRRTNLFLILLLFVSLSFLLMLTRWLILQRKFQKKQKELQIREISVKQLEVERLQKNEELQTLRNEKIELDLKTRERELVSIALHVDQVSEFLEGLAKSLRQLVGKVSGEPQAELAEIEKTIRNRIRETGNPDLFNTRFNQLHAEFFNQLKKDHPGLSPSDMKFCAYLRIHLSSNQIATILNVTHEAIRKTRYRLRKKLGLEPEASLEEYISSY